MQILNESNKQIILRVDPGEELREVVQNVCKEKKISVGWVNALGSSAALQLAYYNLDTKEYETKDYDERLEITTITGNIARKDGEPFLHIHGTFSDADMKVVGGHVNSCVISATGEVVIHVGEGDMVRLPDEDTGLSLLQKE